MKERWKRMARERISLDKEMIVEKAWEMVDADGPSAMSARKISNALGVSPMTLYKYVENIDAIVKEIIIKGFTIINGNIERKLDDMEKNGQLRKAEEIFSLISDEVFDFALAHKDIYILMFNADGTKFRDDPDLFILYSGVRHTMQAYFGDAYVERNRMGIYIYEVFLNGLIVEKLKNRVDLSKAEFDRHIEFCVKQMLTD